jgi:serine protease Do
MDETSPLTPPSQSTSRKSTSRRSRLLAILPALAVMGLGVGFATSPAYRGSAAPAPVESLSTDVRAAEPHLGFADLAAKVKPAVISVRVKLDEGPSLSAESGDEDGLPFPPGSPMEKFFRFGIPFPPQGENRKRPVITGEGSGFFISADGYAVTNNHVVDHASAVRITTDDGKTYPAKVVGTDKKTDLALIKVDGRDDFPFVTFAGKAPRIGDWVMVVGNPFGLNETVTAGIISAQGRNIAADPYDDFLQIDAPINQGNSGGPAFNLDGEVVGVTTAIYSVSGGSVGIGFAIPAETAKMVVADLKSTGHVTRGWLGAEIQQVTPSVAESLGLQQAKGALVAVVKSGSPAMRAHLRAGDVVMAVNGQPVKGSADLVRKIGTLAPGASAELQILRNGSQKTLTVTLGNTPGKLQVAELGLSLAPASSVVGEGSNGVVVTKVKPDSAAEEQGIQTGDVILEVAGKAVSTPSEVRKDVQVSRASGERHVLIRLRSGDQTRYVALPVGHA